MWSKVAGHPLTPHNLRKLGLKPLIPWTMFWGTSVAERPMFIQTEETPNPATGSSFPVGRSWSRVQRISPRQKPPSVRHWRSGCSRLTASPGYFWGSDFITVTNRT